MNDETAAGDALGRHLRETPRYYDVLGVSLNASPAQIKAAYRAAIRKYHPDVNRAPNAQRLTALLNEAYATLSHPDKRRAHDAALASRQFAKTRRQTNAPARRHASRRRAHSAPFLSTLFTSVLSMSNQWCEIYVESCELAFGMLCSSITRDMES
ncbi:MAG: J domain-containing protein [Vulcanimicrobiaceae bacterium]|jgi:curved DNA-binding protein CbpA